MSFFNSLLISGLLCGWNAPEVSDFPTGNCATIEVSYTVEQLQVGQSELSVNPKGGKAPYKILMMEESGALLSDDYSKTKFEGLKKGKYFCLVVDSDRCMKKIEIQVP